MKEQVKTVHLNNVVIRFSGDSGDGMQLAGTLFSNISAFSGNDISTFPDYPSEIRAPQGLLSGVSGFQVHIGPKVYTPGDKTDVLIAMNPAALKINVKALKNSSVIIIDSDSFMKKDLDKALFTTDNPFEELGIAGLNVIQAPISTMVKDSLAESGMEGKDILRCKNMFALGLVCWLFDRSLPVAETMLRTKFAKKPTIAEANIKVLNDGYNFGANTHASVPTYHVATGVKEKGFYTDVDGNTATAYGLLAASEKSGLELFLGSYPITPATDILQELAKHKSMGVKTMQMEDEIAGICTAIGASFAGSFAATTTSGPGLALKGEAIGLAVMAELPLVIVNVQRGGPSTGLPTKSEQTDLMQALYGRNGESPVVVVSAKSPTNCFDAAFWSSKIALEHMTPVILLTDGFIANGSSAFKIPNLATYPPITPNFVNKDVANWTPYLRNEETKVRYWATPGTEGFQHRIGGLEKDYKTSVISTDGDNHELMVATRQAKIDAIANYIPELEVEGNVDADVLVVGWGGTYGHLCSAVNDMNDMGKKIAFAHFSFISPLPKNTEKVLRKYKKIVVCEQNLGQFAGYLRMKIQGLNIYQYNQVTGQPFLVSELVKCFTKIMEN
ncbi:MAG: 2-oxoacid:acceptor oxidoreductase subunit alpha [Paludibacteraceae bacterium]|nr:2-oxoacid:acceptor oxidoreductase subunit alpha [Paludibacteraceae bacterium]MBP6283867.1 2-oxoacid:acceptor oxidoreductase subunit alpha [Paludibacteraceae bacterium]